MRTPINIRVRKVGRRRKRIDGEMVARKKAHQALTAKRQITRKGIVGSGQIFNVEAAAAGDHIQEEQQFIATSFASKNRVARGWLINSGCTNHMTSNECIFKKIGKRCDLKVRIGNGELLEAKRKGDVLINISTVLKHAIFEEVARKDNIGVCCKMVKKE
ncbi:hypothetical protein J1N35_024695 [Gossypium stocksii]|uniref:Retrovirus-related Pol polyprotein from transposon TNT 1-94-like beta-barrel domain-containing protein n=1 Tax=Gossypium stocksii TaxID=47602 RepID=A0A9D3V577_9ROSI|nr:hypothetical protein J1N35_024695 [Gossypium stocksii]